ncbi:hypothetical protein [Streptomyces sp. URMC 129]|uniref:hypothetical protein n=1 Tax=Streptomyces sp. URMC 129 TaxID=3423407 RepID=UPI003F1CEACD
MSRAAPVWRVRTVFAWSYRTLPPPAARLFRRLGLRPGPDFSAPAAAALAGEPPARVRGLLDLLAGAHLIEQTDPERYQFHDLLRAYATAQAHQDETGEDRQAALTRLTRSYLRTADATRAAAWQLPTTLHGLHIARGSFDDRITIARTGLHATTRLDDPRAQALMHDTRATA